MSPTQPSHGRRLGDDDQRGRRVGLTARFLQAVGVEVGAGTLTPYVLARAIAQVLPVDGAGLSMLTRGLRMPLGSSGPEAVAAEELQTTLGEGPCLEAAARQESVVVDLPELTARWPLYTDGLTGQTSFRSVAAFALRAPGHGVFAALDVFSSEPSLSSRLDLRQVDEHLAAPTAALLSSCLERVHGLEAPEAMPEWYTTAAGRRHNVWMAIGMLMVARPRRAADALSLMRAQAWTQGRSLDDLAADVVEGRLLPDELDE